MIAADGWGWAVLGLSWAFAILLGYFFGVVSK